MAIPNSGRLVPLTIKKMVDQAKIDNPTAVVTSQLRVCWHGKEISLIFFGVVAVLVNGVQIAAYYMASSSSGKLKVFGDVDSAVRAYAAVLPNNDGKYLVSVDVGGVLDKRPPVDLIKAAGAERLRCQGARTKALAEISARDAQLTLMAGWSSGNALQVARYDEVAMQKTALTGAVASLDAEIVRLTAIVGI